jgi:WD40 repeat protein
MREKMDDSLVGSRISRYEILDCVTKTESLGFYKAYDTKLERHVFLKMVLHAAEYSKESVDYFLSESKALGKLSHPNIAKVLDFGYDNGNLFLISEYIHGKSLVEFLSEPIEWTRAVEILIPLTDALAYAHTKGVLHRDLKPENIIFNDENEPVLSDFSLVRIIEDEETKDMTGTNVGLGSPAYISPEQGKGLPADFRSDVYSLGVIFFEMVTGQKPFSAGNSMEIVIQHVTADPPKPTTLNPNLPRSVEEIVLSALTKNIEKRYQTMEQFSDALKSVVTLQGQGSTKFRKTIRLNRAILALIGFGLVLGLPLLWLFTQGSLFNKAANLPEATFPAEVVSIDTSPTQPIQEIMPKETANVEPEKTSLIPASESLSYSFMAIPALQNEELPAAGEPISSENVSQITELARWGTPKINQLTFIDNDQLLLAATSSGLYYYDSKNLEPRHFFDTKGWLSTLAVSKDGQWVATGDTSGAIAVWKVTDGSQIAWLEGHSGEIISLGFSSDKTKLVSTSIDKTIRVWDIQQNAELFEPQRSSFRINKVAFMPNDDVYISGGDDFQIMLWNASNGQLIKKISASQKINDLTVSSDGKKVAVALNSAVIEIWNLDDGKLENQIQDWKIIAPYTSITFLPNDQLILLGSADGITRIWNILSSEKIWETPRKDKEGNELKTSPTTMVAISNDSTKIVAISDSQQIEIWDIANQQLLVSKNFEFTVVKRIALSPNGKFLAYQMGDSLVKIVSTNLRETISSLKGILPRGAPFSSDSSQIIIESKDLYHYSITETKTELLHTYYEPPPNGFVNFLLNDKIAASAKIGVIKYWSTSSGRELAPYTLKSEGNCRVIYHLDGSFLAAGSLNGILSDEIYLNHFCKISRGPRVTSSHFLHDGSIFAFSLENQNLEVWNALANQKESLRSESKGNMLDVTISSDGVLLAAASASGVIEIYNLTTMELVKTLDAHTAPVNTLLFSADGGYLISGSSDGTVRFWGLYP